MIKEKRRIHFIDIARGIVIILMVIGHTDAPFALNNIFFQFHMPFFFFLSGFLYQDKYDSNPKAFIMSRLRGLYKPYLKYCLILIIIYSIIYYLATDTFFYHNLPLRILQFVTGYDKPHMGGAMWFLTCLLIVSILFVLIRYTFYYFGLKGVKGNICMITLLIVFLIIGYKTQGYEGQLPFKLSSALVALTFYYSGFIYSKYQDKVKFNYVSLIISFIIIVIFSLFNKVNLSGNEYTYFPLFLIGSYIGSYLIIGISKLIHENEILEYVGKNTLPIIAYHFLAFMFVNLLLVYIYNLPFHQVNDYPTIKGYGLWWIIYSIVGIVFPLIADNAEDKFKRVFHKLINK